MNSKIVSLENSLNELAEKQRKDRLDLENQLNREYWAVFQRDKELQAAIDRLTGSKEYGIDGDLIYSWVRYSAVKYSDCLERLQDYLQNSDFDIDNKNNALLYFQGPQLLITESNHVYDQDSQKIIIHASEYKNWEERNSMIETWMNVNGYFPGVFRIDRYNNVFLIDTTEK